MDLKLRAAIIAAHRPRGVYIPTAEASLYLNGGCAAARRGFVAAASKRKGRCRMSDLTFKASREVNSARAARWHKGGISDWSITDWSNALAGEVGEACNAIKKLRRIQNVGDLLRGAQMIYDWMEGGKPPAEMPE
jgi:hypothetical protein